ncbi:hypothetical protein D9C73_006793 [Collichthys lucidus]|uniref:DUF4592 domain-containing protein n=1 Tax=Collichthys lucidus TaxID=240159 RepID=A0A4U5UDR2_COLLU|nr:hypothetical protein D9C73_006793 [Collichthys lucidus]
MKRRMAPWGAGFGSGCSSDSAAMASGPPDVTVNQEPAEAVEECSGKKKSKFQTFKKLFTRKKKKDPPAVGEDAGLKASQSSDNVSKTSENNTLTRSEKEKGSGSKISLGSKALSHDSVFVSDSSEANEALGASQDSIHGKVKSLQLQLKQAIRLGSPPSLMCVKKTEDGGTMSEDDGLPCSPPEYTTLHTVMNPPQRNSSNSMEGMDSDDDQLSCAATSRAVSPLVVPGDFSQPASPFGCLDNSAAKHKLGLRYKACNKRKPISVREPHTYRHMSGATALLRGTSAQVVSDDEPKPKVEKEEDEQGEAEQEQEEKEEEEEEEEEKPQHSRQSLLRDKEEREETEDESETEQDVSHARDTSSSPELCLSEEEAPDAQPSPSSKPSSRASSLDSPGATPEPPAGPREYLLDPAGVTYGVEEDRAECDLTLREEDDDDDIQESREEESSFLQEVLSSLKTPLSSCSLGVETEGVVLEIEEEEADEGVDVAFGDVTACTQRLTKDDETPAELEEREERVEEGVEINHTVPEMDQKGDAEENRPDVGQSDQDVAQEGEEISNLNTKQVEKDQTEATEEAHASSKPSPLSLPESHHETPSQDSGAITPSKTSTTTLHINLISPSSEKVTSFFQQSPTAACPNSETPSHALAPTVQNTASTEEEEKEEEEEEPSDTVETVEALGDEATPPTSVEETAKQLSSGSDQSKVRFTIAPAWQRSLSVEDVKESSPSSPPACTSSLPEVEATTKKDPEVKAEPASSSKVEVVLSPGRGWNAGITTAKPQSNATTPPSSSKPQTSAESSVVVEGNPDNPFGVRLRKTSVLHRFSSEEESPEHPTTIEPPAQPPGCKVDAPQPISAKPSISQPVSSKPALPKKPDVHSDPAAARGVSAGSDSPSWISVAKQKQKIYKENSVEEITVKKKSPSCTNPPSLPKTATSSKSPQAQSTTVTSPPFSSRTAPEKSASRAPGLSSQNPSSQRGMPPPALPQDEPPWMALAKKKAKAWSEMPQIVQ